MKENKTYYKKKIYFILLIMTLVFSFTSLYEYYSESIENPFLRISNVLFGILKMFLFTPPISPEKKHEYSVWNCKMDGSDTYISLRFYQDIQYPAAPEKHSNQQV